MTANTYKLNFLKNSFKKTHNFLDQEVVKELYQLKLLPNSFYKLSLISDNNSLILKKPSLLKPSQDKLRQFKSWSFKETITTLILLQNILKTKKTIVGNILRKKKGGGLGLLCQLKNSILLNYIKTPSMKRFRFHNTFLNLTRFEFFIPYSHLKQLFHTNKNKNKFQKLKHLVHRSKKFNTVVNLNILKLKILRYRYRRTKRLINVVSGFNNLKLKKKKKNNERKIYKKRLKNQTIGRNF